LLVAVAALAAAWFVVPEFRRWTGLDAPTPAVPAPAPATTKVDATAAKPSSNQPFSIEVEHSGPMADKGNWVNGFWIEYPTSEGKAVTAAQVTLLLRFVNSQSDPEYIDTFTVELKSDGKWVALTRLPTSGTTGYFAYSVGDPPSMDEALSAAKRVDFSEYGLENQLARTGGLLKPGEMVRGWALYEFPSTLQQVDRTTPIRVTVTDVKGRTATHIHYRSEEKVVDERALKPELSFPAEGPVDLSKLPRRRWRGAAK
jgi:hypothetical protein